MTKKKSQIHYKLYREDTLLAKKLDKIIRGKIVNYKQLAKEFYSKIKPYEKFTEKDYFSFMVKIRTGEIRIYFTEKEYLILKKIIESYY